MELTLFDLFSLGGWAMWPLVVFSVATVALFIERAVILLVHDLRTKPLRDALIPLMADGDTTEALRVCGLAPRRLLVAEVYAATVETAHLPETLMERVFEARASQQVTTLERGLDLLVALGSIAPITGFLGTVSGMISAFNSIATAADVNAQLVAGGIFEALITTAFGLAIALVAITGYNLFSHFIDRFAGEMEQAGNDLIAEIVRGRSEAESASHASSTSLPGTHEVSPAHADEPANDTPS